MAIIKESDFLVNGWGWLVYETHHLPIHIHLQAMGCKRGWLKYKSGSSSEFCFQSKISLAQTYAPWHLIGDIQYMF